MGRASGTRWKLAAELEAKLRWGLFTIQAATLFPPPIDRHRSHIAQYMRLSPLICPASRIMVGDAHPT